MALEPLKDSGKMLDGVGPLCYTGLDRVAQELADYYSPQEWYKINDRVLQLYDLKGPNSLKAA